jgi:hypothetical protein
MMRTEIEQLALDIARCTEISVAVTDAKHPCHKISHTQVAVNGKYRQVPEAWVGNLATAKILVVSSNPSISTPEKPGTGEVYPLAGFADLAESHPDWADDNMRLIDFQTQRLNQDRNKPFVTQNAQFFCEDKVYRGGDKVKSTKKSQNYWKAAFKQGQDLLGDSFSLGHDLCLTEIVHCKSKREAGVAKAAPLCSQKYLHRILDSSNARLLVIGGRQAREMVIDNYGTWNEQDGHQWEIGKRFGQLRGDNIEARDHIGLFTSAKTQCITIACQQMSYTSNTRRFVEQVIGSDAAQILKGILQATNASRFENRDHVLQELGLS